MTLSNEQLENILYLHQQGISYRAISKQYSISTTSITGALRRYRETGTILPPPTKRFSRYDPYQEKVCERIRYLLAVGKSSPSTRKRQRTTVDLIHQVLCEDGYSISLSKTKQLVRYEKNRLKEGYLDITHTPGVMCQFDWGQSQLIVNGKKRKVFFAVFALPYSNYRFIKVTKSMNGKAFTDAFHSFVEHMNGIFPVLLIDNMKIARKNTKCQNQEQQLTDLFRELSVHYGFEVRFCTPYRPHQKGTVENAVKILK